jgi:hypothetical protein
MTPSRLWQIDQRFLQAFQARAARKAGLDPETLDDVFTDSKHFRQGQHARRGLTLRRSTTYSPNTWPTLWAWTPNPTR